MKNEIELKVFVRHWERQPLLNGRRLILIANVYNEKENKVEKIYKYADTNEVLRNTLILL